MSEPSVSSPAKPSRLAAYWRQSRQPLFALAFVAPLLVLYEGGVLLLGPDAMRNGADVWLRQLLDWVGLGGYFLLPALTVGTLLAWHHTTGQGWRIRPVVLWGMLAESGTLSIVLVMLAHAQARLLGVLGRTLPDAALDAQPVHVVGRLVSFFGAGIYEETLFRLMLLPLVAMAIAALGGSMRLRQGGAILVTSLAFAAAHYVGAHGEAFQWSTFIFRFAAGAFFAVLFVCRGFGIVVGTHALYDVLVGMG